MGEQLLLKKEPNVELEAYCKNYLNPKYVFLPISEGYKVKVIDNAYVYKNDIVMFTRSGRSMHSSISGKVLGVKTMLYCGDKQIPSLVIENDFKENIRIRKSAKKYIEEYSKKEFMCLLEDSGYVYKDKFLVDKLNGDNEELLINGIELEPHFGNKYFVMEKHAEELLETIDLMSELFSYKKTILAIKNNDSEIVSNFLNLIGTYPNIELRLLNDNYPIGHSLYLAKELELRHPLVLDITEINDIYTILKKQLPVSEKIITITGDAITPKAAIKVKIGTLLSEVFINNFDFSKKNVDVYLNGLISGKKIDTLKYVIDTNIDGIVVTEKDDKIPDVCINCGLCSKHCPMGLNPKYVFDHNGHVLDKYKDKCIQCGLCNYVCPSNIDLKNYMKGDTK